MILHRPAAICKLLLLLLATPAAAEDTSTRPLLRVTTGYASPFVRLPGTPVSGFAVELWQEIARRLGADTAWTVLPDLSEDAQIDRVARGEADLAVSALAMTPEREARVDFTAPYYTGGLEILVEGAGLPAILRLAIAPAALGVLGVALAVVLALAHLLWLVERRHDPVFQRGYLRGIAEGVWGVVLIIATGEHGDRHTQRVLKRLVIAALWLTGVVLTAQFTAAITAALTVEQLQPTIQGPEDLPGRRIATAPGSLAAAWLTNRGLPFTPVADSERAYAMLVRGEIDAIVYGGAQLRHWIMARGRSAAVFVGQPFRPEAFAIAVPLGSPLRKRINEALLAMQADGTAEEIQRRWMGAR